MRNESYGRGMSEVYDALNKDIDYEKWADFVENCISKFCPENVSHICEIACGTGTMSVILEKRGYNVTSSDLSEEMLTFADKKAFDASCRNVVFTKQDMRSFTTSSKAQCVICLLDSVNCLLKPSEVKMCFESANAVLDDGGLFIFDVNSRYKFESVYSDNAYVLEDDGILCAWQNFYNDKSRICDFFLSFFLKQPNGSYERFDEEQRERMYTEKQLKKYLDENGFDVCGVFSDFDFKKADENSDERLHFVSVKRKQ